MAAGLARLLKLPLAVLEKCGPVRCDAFLFALCSFPLKLSHSLVLQCKPSRGRKRGICWCVDKYGVMLPGTDYSGGDIQCKDLESSINE